MKIYEPKISYSLVKEVDEKLSDSQTVAMYVREKVMSNPMQENFFLISLSRKNHVMNCHLITIGSESACIVDFKECFRRLYLDKAASFIIAHNHPSGEILPSVADDKVTKKFKEMSDLLDFCMLDSIIVGDYSHYSYHEKGLL